MPKFPRKTTEQLGLPQVSQLPPIPLGDDTDIGGPPILRDTLGNPVPKSANSLVGEIKLAPVDKDCMRDPLNDTFYEDIWRRIADNNTKIFRQVFRCNPDSEVTSWDHYREYTDYGVKFAQAQSGLKTTDTQAQDAPSKSGPTGASVGGAVAPSVGLNYLAEKAVNSNAVSTVSEWAEKATARLDSGKVHDQNTHGPVDGNDEKMALGQALNEPHSPTQPPGSETFPPLDNAMLKPSHPNEEGASTSQQSNRKATFSSATSAEKTNGPITSGSTKKRRRGTTRGSRIGFRAADDLMSSQEIDELLGMIQGHLVVFPYDWLVKEENNSNWLFQVDQVAPLQIYD
jgi:phospholipase D1/2